MTTIQDIADKLGISKGTVSKALNGAPDISNILNCCHDLSPDLSVLYKNII